MRRGTTPDVPATAVLAAFACTLLLAGCSVVTLHSGRHLEASTVRIAAGLEWPHYLYPRLTTMVEPALGGAGDLRLRAGSGGQIGLLELGAGGRVYVGERFDAGLEAAWSYSPFFADYPEHRFDLVPEVSAIVARWRTTHEPGIFYARLSVQISLVSNDPFDPTPLRALRLVRPSPALAVGLDVPLGGPFSFVAEITATPIGLFEFPYTTPLKAAVGISGVLGGAHAADEASRPP